jgi:hypothetical protein
MPRRHDHRHMGGGFAPQDCWPMTALSMTEPMSLFRTHNIIAQPRFGSGFPPYTDHHGNIRNPFAAGAGNQRRMQRHLQEQRAQQRAQRQFEHIRHVKRHTPFGLGSPSSSWRHRPMRSGYRRAHFPCSSFFASYTPRFSSPYLFSGQTPISSILSRPIPVPTYNYSTGYSSGYQPFGRSLRMRIAPFTRFDRRHDLWEDSSDDGDFEDDEPNWSDRESDAGFGSEDDYDCCGDESDNNEAEWPHSSLARSSYYIRPCTSYMDGRDRFGGW